MSAENSRLVRSIRRIANEPADQSGSVDPEKARGDQPGGQGVGESDAERDRICCDGSTNGSANPGASERDTSDGGQDGLDPSDPANIDSGPGELSGVVDCATGQPVCLAGDDFIPPEGWGDPQSPGYAEGYLPGYYWGAGVIAAFTALESFSLLEASRSDCTYTVLEQTDTRLLYRSLCNGQFAEGTIRRYECVGSNPGQFCGADVAPPLADQWPEDGCVNLAIVNGSIAGSKYDPENDGSYSAPRKEIELCDGDNSILIRPSAGGGWKSIKSLEGDIDPNTQAGYLYRPNGQRVRQISPSEFRDDTV